eukprot:m.211864 g.211864  ORF g.211864 m.211864 type:complete len:943 (+) comp39761_c0_seq11:331-3159(+)
MKMSSFACAEEIATLTAAQILSADIDQLSDWVEESDIDDSDFKSVLHYQEALLDFLIAKGVTGVPKIKSPIASLENIFQECRSKQIKFGEILDDIKEIVDGIRFQEFQEQVGIDASKFWQSDDSDSYEKFKTDLTDSRPTLLVAGSTSSGKSTLVNTLIGENVLPVSYDSSTAVLCEVQNSPEKDRKFALVHLLTERKRKLDLTTPSDISIFRSYAKGDEVDGLQCSKIEVFWPCEFLKYFTIVDSPGVTGGEEEMRNAEFTSSFQKKLACGLLYILDASRAAEEAISVGHLVAENSSVFPSPSSALFIASKWDILEGSQSREVQEDYRRIVKQYIRMNWRGFKDDQLISFKTRRANKALKLGYLTDDMRRLCCKLKTLLVKGIDCHISRKLRVILHFVQSIKVKLSRAEILGSESVVKRLLLPSRVKSLEEFYEQIQQIQDDVRDKVKEASISIAAFLQSKEEMKNIEDFSVKRKKQYGQKVFDYFVINSLTRCTEFWVLQNNVNKTFKSRIELLQGKIERYAAEFMAPSGPALSKVLIKVLPGSQRRVGTDWGLIREVSLFTTSCLLLGPIGACLTGIYFVSRNKKRQDALKANSQAFLRRLCENNQKSLQDLLYKLSVRMTDSLQILEHLSQKQMTELKQEIAMKPISKELYEYIQNSCQDAESMISECIVGLSIHEFEEERIIWPESKQLLQGQYQVGIPNYSKVHLEVLEPLSSKVATSQLLRIYNCQLISHNQGEQFGQEHVAAYHGSALINKNGDGGIHVGLLFEWCQGGSLTREIFVDKLAPSRPGGISRARVHANGIAKGLAFLHSKQIVCQALTPADILLTREGNIKLRLPFIDEPLVMSVSHDQELHVAPELLKGCFPNPACDIYSFGIILWELWHGKQYEKPVPREDLVSQMTTQGMTPPWSGKTSWDELANQCLGSNERRPKAIDINIL